MSPVQLWENCFGLECLWLVGFDGGMNMRIPFSALTWCLLVVFVSGFVLPTLGASTAATPSLDQGQCWVYFGTYTGEKSKGIYVSRLDLATGKLTEPELAGEATSPSFVAVHPSGSFLYAVNEVSRFAGKRSGAVSAFAIDAKTGALSLLNQQPSGGDGPCHVNVDHSGKDVLVANYGGGSCSVFRLQSDGRLEASSAFIQHRGSSANQQRQGGPHAHGIYLDPKNRFAFVPDLGLDRIQIYKFDPAQGSLTPNDPPFATVAPGSGPRHLAFDPAGQHVYVISEILCTVTAFNYDSDRGRFEQFQTISTLPEGVNVLPSYSTAEIAVHPSG